MIPHLFRQKAEERKISRGLKDYSNFIYNLDVVANLSPQITYLQTDFSSKVSVQLLSTVSPAFQLSMAGLTKLIFSFMVHYRSAFSSLFLVVDTFLNFRS